MMLLIAAGLFASSHATAAEAEDTAARPLSFTAEASLRSDYRFRGVSLSNRNPVFQADLAIEHDSGLYAGVWSSTLAETEGGASFEVDPYIGYYAEMDWGLTADFMLSYYGYPSDSSLNYAEATATFTYPAGPVTPKLELNYAPRQPALVDEYGRKADNFYVSGGLEYQVGDAPVTLAAQVGHERGAYDYRQHGGKTDWSLGVRFETGPAALGLTYVDANVSVLDEAGRNLAGRGVVASLTVSL